MELDIISYNDLNDKNIIPVSDLKKALLQKGIVGIRDVPGFAMKSRSYIDTARKFASLNDSVKQQYAPDRDSGDTEGYELSAEWFKDDTIKATKHMVKKAKGEIERFTFALFYSASNETIIKSHSKLIEDERYKLNQLSDGSILYSEWNRASFKKYKAINK